MMHAELWSWASPVWLVAAALVAGYLVLAKGHSRRQLASLLLGAVLLAAAFVTPVGELADGYLFSAHMVQHLILLLLVPLCVLLSLPRKTATAWFGRTGPDRIGRLLSVAWVGWMLGVGAMWFWHVPVLCSAATERPTLGIIRDMSLVFAGLAFWWPVYAPLARYRLDPLAGIAYLFSACLGCTLLGIYITFAPISVCPAFANPAERLGIVTRLYDAGLTPAVDQHLGGLMMWVPPCILYVAAIIGILSRWYAAEGDASQPVRHEPTTLGLPHESV